MKNLEDMKADISARWYGFTWNVKRKYEEGKKWCEDHTELAIAMIPVGLVAIKGIGNTVRSIDRKIDQKREDERREKQIFDHSLGKWHELRRPMTMKETIEFDARRGKGESTVSILYDMGLLRR